MARSVSSRGTWAKPTAIGEPARVTPPPPPPPTAAPSSCPACGVATHSPGPCSIGCTILARRLEQVSRWLEDRARGHEAGPSAVAAVLADECRYLSRAVRRPDPRTWETGSSE